MPSTSSRQLELRARSLASIILQMNDHYEAAKASNTVPSKPRWKAYCQQQWDAKRS